MSLLRRRTHSFKGNETLVVTRNSHSLGLHSMEAVVQYGSCESIVRSIVQTREVTALLVRIHLLLETASTHTLTDNERALRDDERTRTR